MKTFSYNRIAKTEPQSLSLTIEKSFHLLFDTILVCKLSASDYDWKPYKRNVLTPSEGRSKCVDLIYTYNLENIILQVNNW